MAIITSADLLGHLGIEDTIDDTTATNAVNAANQAVIEYCGRNFDKFATASPTARQFFPRSDAICDIDDIWETTVLVVKTDSGDDGTFETTWTINTDFYLVPLNGLMHGQAWPYNRIVATGTRLFPTSGRRPSVQVTAAWGWTAVPGAVFEATLIKAARIFKRKLSPEGVLGGFSDFGPVRISRIEDPDVVDLLAPFRHPSRVALVG